MTVEFHKNVQVFLQYVIGQDAIFERFIIPMGKFYESDTTKKMRETLNRPKGEGKYYELVDEQVGFEEETEESGIIYQQRKEWHDAGYMCHVCSEPFLVCEEYLIEYDQPTGCWTLWEPPTRVLGKRKTQDSEDEPNAKKQKTASSESEEPESQQEPEYGY